MGIDFYFGLSWFAEEKKMIPSLFGVGTISFLVGLVVLVPGIDGKMSADTTFGKFSGRVGAVALIMGLVMMVVAAML